MLRVTVVTLNKTLKGTFDASSPAVAPPPPFPPADVVGLARVLEGETVGSVFILVGADGNDGLSPAFGTGGLVAGWTGAEQHPVAVFGGNLCFQGEGQKSDTRQPPNMFSF